MNGKNNSIIGKPRHEPEGAALKELRIRALLTSRCRYRAASRLSVLSKFSFYSTILLSLGLMLIPLFSMTGKDLVFTDSALHLVEVFLATAVLVFSSVTGVAQYELRSYLLNKCGRELKDLAVEISGFLEFNKNDSDASNAYGRYLINYSHISGGAENHTEVDYRLALLSMPEYYEISKSRRIIYWIVTAFLLVIPYCVPLFFMVMEFIFIIDMLGLFSPFVVFTFLPLNGS
jgi:SMODS and SLOG-associating 2TM effector domain family 5